MAQPTSLTSKRYPVIIAMLLALTFAAAYGQAPLYYSNQNQYFLHGLAAANEGLLKDDWLAGTLDPTPVFSILVAWTVQYLQPWYFHLYHAVLLGLYAVIMLSFFDLLVGREVAARCWPAFLVLLVLLHSAALRWLSYRLLGQDYPWYFQAGVAGQYILGGMLQPSVFAVFLLLAICLFARGHHYLAALAIAVAASSHATYLLPGALLTLGFLAALLRERRWRRAVELAALTLLLVLPTTIYTFLTFAPTDPEAAARAQDILVNIRIPHHSRPDLWLDPIAALQIGWLILGMALTWRTPLFTILVVPFSLATLLTLVQQATDNDALALLFPWRISAVLVPLATTVVLSRLVSSVALPVTATTARNLSLGALLVLTMLGVWISVGRHAFRTADDELALYEFVQREKKPGDLYFLPVRIPNLAATTRGSLSSDFKPLPEKRQDTRIVPVDLQRFRLHTGAPIYVDFKSIPYRENDVLEWYRRLTLAQEISEQIKEGRLEAALSALHEIGVTHMVLAANQQLDAPGVQEVHADPAYRVYQLMRPR